MHIDLSGSCFDIVEKKLELRNDAVVPIRKFLNDIPETALDVNDAIIKYMTTERLRLNPTGLNMQSTPFYSYDEGNHVYKILHEKFLTKAYALWGYESRKECFAEIGVKINESTGKCSINLKTFFDKAGVLKRETSYSARAFSDYKASNLYKCTDSLALKDPCDENPVTVTAYCLSPRVLKERAVPVQIRVSQATLRLKERIGNTQKLYLRLLIYVVFFFDFIFFGFRTKIINNCDIKTENVTLEF